MISESKTHITVTFDDEEIDLETINNSELKIINNSELKIILIIPTFTSYDLSGITRDVEKIITYYIPQHYDVSNIYKTINSLKVELKYLFISNDFWYRTVRDTNEIYENDIKILLKNINKKIKLVFIDKNKY